MAFPVTRAIRSDDLEAMVKILNRCTSTSLNEEEQIHLFRWLRSALSQGLADSTVDAYARSAARFLAWLRARGRTFPEKLTPAQFTEYQIHLCDSMRTSSVNRHLYALKVFVDHLYVNGFIPTDPTKALRLGRVANGRTKWIREGEARRLFAAAKEGLEKAVFLTYYRTGIRKMELAGLKTSDIDLEDGVLMVYGQKTRSYRLIPLPDDLVRQLSSYLDQRPSVDRPEFFVTEQKHVKLYSQLLQRWWSCWVNEAGLSEAGYSLHTLRHTAASNWLNHGLGIREVAELLGHRDINSTFRYLHVCPTTLRNRVGAINFAPLDAETADAA